MPRRDHDHIGGSENVRNIPAIAHHEHISVESRAIDGLPHPFLAASSSGRFADENEMGVGALVTNNASGLHQIELSFVRTNHADVHDDRSFLGKSDLAPE